jgi:hypothetical protein
LRKALGYLEGDALDAKSEGYRYYPGGGTPTKTMTAVGLLCRHFLQGWDGRSERMAKGINSHILPNSPKAEIKDVYFTFYATQTMLAFGGEEWKKWNAKNRDLIVRSRDADDAKPEVFGSWSPVGDQWGQMGGRLMKTALNILTLEVYYRYPPQRAAQNP